MEIIEQRADTRPGAAPADARQDGGHPHASGFATHELTVAEIDEILAIRDPTLRNLRVTIGYHDLSHALASVLGYEDANWCTFAVWASREAGRFVRGESVEGTLGRMLDGLKLSKRATDGRQARHAALKAMLGKAVARVVSAQLDQLDHEAHTTAIKQLRDADDLGPGDLSRFVTLLFEDFSAHISRGNTVVFDEIARALVPFVAQLRKDPEDARALETLIDELDPSDRPAHQGGQRSLKRALSTYARARRERDPARRSALVYLANCLIGDQEQTALQTEIMLALEAPIDLLVMRLAKDLVRGYNPSPLHWVANTAFRRLVLPIGAPIASMIWKAVATHAMMALHLPNEKLYLGDDMPPLPSGEAFPPALVELLDDEAKRCVDYFNFAYGNTLFGTGAHDWSSFPERMNSITNLFRSRQQTRALFLPPFTATAMAKIRANHIPAKLDRLGGRAPSPIWGSSGRPPQAR
jgi:hypothetical protein